MGSFFAALLDHIPEFLALLALVAGSLYLLLRRHISSLLDPLFFLLVLNEAFCITDVLFMYLYGLIEARYFTHYMLSEAALFLGLLCFRPRFSRPTPGPLSAEPPAALKTFFVGAFSLLVGLNLLVYTQRGIPLFLDSRLVVYRAGGGWGLVDRLFDILIPGILYYLLEVLRRRRWRLGEWASLVTLIAIQILSGAKSSVVTLLYLIGSYGLHSGVAGSLGARTGRMLKRLTLAAAASLLLVTFVQTKDVEIGGRQVTAIDQVAARAVSAGDAMIYAYPDRTIDQLDGSRPVYAVLKEFLAFFRIVAPDDLPKHLGVQITDRFIGLDSNFQTNAKHNLFGYLYFGYWGGILFSFLLGISIGWLRYVFPGLFPRTWIWGISFMILNSAFIISVNDLDSGPRGLLNILLFLPMALVAKQVVDRGGSTGKPAQPPADGTPTFPASPPAVHP